MAVLIISGKKVLVDDEDLELIKPFSWWANAKNYVQGSKFRGDKKIHHYMHRLIMNPPPNLQVDHINKDRLDNRRSNLRIVTRQENQYGKKTHGKTSMFMGVKRVNLKSKKWQAELSLPNVKGVTVLGTYKSEIDAAIAYDVVSVRNFGIYAKTNILPPMPKDSKIEIRYFT